MVIKELNEEASLEKSFCSADEVSQCFWFSDMDKEQLQLLVLASEANLYYCSS